MSIIVMTWENPSDASRAAAADAKAKEWRAIVLKQKGLVEYNAYTGRLDVTDMAVDVFASALDAAAFLGSNDFAGIVSEMKTLGVTNIQTHLMDRHRDVPQALRGASAR